MIELIDIILSVFAFAWGLSVGALLVVYKLYSSTKSAGFKLLYSIVEKVHGVDVSFEDVWDRIKPVIDKWFNERSKNE